MDEEHKIDTEASEGQETGQAEETPVNEHSHLHESFLKKIGKAVDEIGKDAVEAAIKIALSGTGAFSEE